MNKIKPRWVRVVLKYAALTACGIALFLVAHDHATRARGYIAYGGEVFALLFPLLCYTAEKAAKDLCRDFKELFRRNDT